MSENKSFKMPILVLKMPKMVFKFYELDPRMSFHSLTSNQSNHFLSSIVIQIELNSQHDEAPNIIFVAQNINIIIQLQSIQYKSYM